MPYISETTVGLNIKAETVEAIAIIAGLNPENLVGVPTVGPVIQPKNARHTTKSAFTVIRKGISVSFVIPSNEENIWDPM